MDNYRRLALVGALALCVFILARFPAATAFAWFAPDGVGAFGVSGTIWRGEAKVISAGGVQLRNTRWDIALSQLLLGRFGGDVDTRWGGGFLNASGSVSVLGTVRLRDVKGSFDLGQANALLGSPGIGGTAKLDFQELRLENNWPVHAIGTGQLTNLTSAMLGRGAAQLIGDVGFEFDSNTETAPDTVTGKLQDTGGPLQLDGTLELTPPANYEIVTRIAARDTAAESLRRNLSFLGQPEPDGTRIFQLAGSFE
ncbi:MAG: type II secretion system protein N [Gammaproteobacteria bacterium]|nr:type II secretion system protein N [Gammaproteobacteria bacterium]NND54380.1 type II secretion system protein N [Gammaproteobacteria bacterium]